MNILSCVIVLEKIKKKSIALNNEILQITL